MVRDLQGVWPLARNSIRAPDCRIGGPVMDSAIVTALAAIGGSMVGALGSFLGTSVTQRYHDRRNLLATQIARWEALYSDFISESARLLVDALEHNVVDPKNLIPAYALLSRIRLSSSPQVLSAAEDVLTDIMDTYPKPNLTAEQISPATLRHEHPLQYFSEMCRSELDSVQKQF
jgi:hypothetical protein